MAIELKNMVEKIIFNEEQLFELKKALSQLGTNELSIKDVKSMILDQRTQIMEDTIDLLNFYLDQQINYPKEIPSEEISLLHAKLTEPEFLLEEIGRRLERIANKKSNKRGDSESEIREFILKELEAIEIRSWLEVGALLETETGKITDGYNFLMWLSVCVEKYHAYLFGENRVSLPDKVKALKLPKDLEDDFIVIAHNRNINAHNIVKIPSEFFPIIKNGYINLFKHFIYESLLPKVKNQFQFQRNSEILAEIRKEIMLQVPQNESEFNLLFNIILREGKI